MATPRIKSTYSMDVESVRALDALAARWKVTKSEALRRAILRAEEEEGAVQIDSIEALDELQRSLSLSEADAARWEREVAAERTASSRRRRS